MELLEINDKVYRIPKNVMKAFEDMSDYIKELEEKNKRLNFCMQDTYDSANDICGELQQRINKAIEYIENIEEDKEVDNLFINKKEKSFLVFYKIKNDLLKILKGE